MTGFRKVLLNIHLCVGLFACLLLFVLGITGSILVFEQEIDRALNPSLVYVIPQPYTVPLDELAKSAASQYPKARIIALNLSASSPRPDLAYSFSAFQGQEVLQIFVDQYTGRILGSRDSVNNFITKLTQIHRSLMGGRAWQLFNVWGSLFLCLLALSGIYLWWPRKIFGANFKASGRRIVFDLHNSIGFYASAFVFLFAFTAVVMQWGNAFLPLANLLTHSRSLQSEPNLRSDAAHSGQQALGFDRARAIAMEYLSTARVTRIIMPAKPTGTVRIWMQSPEDGPNGRTRLELDRFSGKVLWPADKQLPSLATRYMESWNRGIHTGEILGWPTKILAFLASLSVAFLSITGPLIWILKKTRKKLRKHVHSAPSTELQQQAGGRASMWAPRSRLMDQ